MTPTDFLRAWNALDDFEAFLKMAPPGEAAVAEAMDLLLRLRWVMSQKLARMMRRETPGIPGNEVRRRDDGPVPRLRGRGA